MSSFCRTAQRYSHRVGVPPAKPIKMILEEQSKRTKKAQREVGDDPQSRSGSEEVPVEKVSTEDRERHEYQMLLEALDGNGELPRGWRKVSFEGSDSPITECSTQSCFEPVMLGDCGTSIRLLRRPQEFQVDLRRELQDGHQFHAEAAFQEMGFSGQPDPIPRVFGGLRKDLDDIFLGGGSSDVQAVGQEKGAERMKEMAEQQGQVAEVTSGVENNLQHPVDLTQTQHDKTGSTRKPDWWAQEQRDNEAAYAKLTTDLQDL